MKDRKVLIFAFDDYYPNGGLNDLKHICFNREEIISSLINCSYYDKIQIVIDDGNDIRIEQTFRSHDDEFTKDFFEENIKIDIFD
jgi:hypothetical protein